MKCRAMRCRNDSEGKTKINEYKKTQKGIKVPPGNTAPTLGVERNEFKVDRCDVTMLDMGGRERVRGIWRSCFYEVHGIIYVVDSSDVKRMKEARETVENLLKHPHVSGKPLLVLANKQDKLSSLLPCEIIEQLSLQKLANEHKSLCHIEACSVMADFPKNIDKAIMKGVRWLLRVIIVNYDMLSARILQDTTELSGYEDQRVHSNTVKFQAVQKESARKIVSELQQKERSFNQNCKTLSNMCLKPLQPSQSITTQGEAKIKKKVKKKKINKPKIMDTVSKGAASQTPSYPRERSVTYGSVTIIPTTRAGDKVKPGFSGEHKCLNEARCATSDAIPLKEGNFR
ncbi:ADP-ribosylation factor-like protein 13B [Protopterus annectens]|uniref:ADP-ribosylation factor-like protein 13B n=1 Tax=Protopterus annectens TaxID=7888 RepID=UPI001CF9ECA7|nr:ADP-ribosylation factor-like protein 13B [Protopterus annectens]